MDPEERARRSLDGLSVGDGFGEQFFGARLEGASRRELPRPPWRTTDDTEMASVLFMHLRERGTVDHDLLARQFAERHARDPMRGYGAGAHRILDAIHGGASWREAAQAEFRGQGSMGNGAAMRVAPLGAWFAGDPGAVVLEAQRSAEVTHAHPEGKAGAIAVALGAAALASGEADLFAFVLEHLPGTTGPTREAIERAAALGDINPFKAAMTLGNGSQVLAEDTVPLCLWMAARHRRFEEALWETASLFGDVDTTCAIVGGLVALRDPPPAHWIAMREELRLEDR